MDGLIGRLRGPPTYDRVPTITPEGTYYSTCQIDILRPEVDLTAWSFPGLTCTTSMVKFFVVLSLVLISACADTTSSVDQPSTPGSSKEDGGADGTVNLGPLLDRDGGPDADISSLEDAAVNPSTGGVGGTGAGTSGSGGVGGATGGMGGSGGQGGSSGSDAGDAGSDAETPDPECPGSGPGTKCEGRKRFACESGQWVEQETCDHVCEAGECTGVCDPGDQDCQGDFPRTCNDNGEWVAGQECSFVCSEGECEGQCVPGDRDCSGLTPRSCNSEGRWVNENACSFYCGGEGVCSGVCASGDRDCSGDVPRHCDGTGQWVAESACPFVCSGEGVCSGSCDPGAESCSGDTPRTCNASGAWVNGTTCPFVCSSGDCVGVCEPGDRDCSGKTPRQCNAQGQWVAETACPFVCGGEGVCSGVCDPAGAPTCSGDVPRTCNSAGQWVNGSACPFLCSAGACTGVCEPGDRQCSGQQIRTCGSNAQWQTATNCPAVAGATSYCSASACTFDCNLDYDDCDDNPANGCEVNLDTDANNCGQCGHSCCGGTCGSGTCAADTLVASGVTAFTVDSTAETLYYAISSVGVNRHDISSGDESLFAARSSAQATVTDVTMSEQRVAWGERNSSTSWAGIYSRPTSGGSSRVESECLTCTATPTNLLYDATNLYWQWAVNTQVLYNPIATPNPNPTLPYSVYATEAGGGNAFAEVYQFTSDGTHLYARLYDEASHPDHVIHKALPTNSGLDQDITFESFPGTNSSLAAPVTDGVNLYYVVYEYSGSPSYPNIGVWKKPIAGGSAQQLVNTTTLLPRLATDGVNVYYADSASGQYRLRKVPVAGGSPVTVTNLSTGINFNRIRAANECVFWQTGTSISGVAVNP